MGHPVYMDHCMDPSSSSYLGVRVQNLGKPAYIILVHSLLNWNWHWSFIRPLFHDASLMEKSHIQLADVQVMLVNYIASFTGFAIFEVTKDCYAVGTKPSNMKTSRGREIPAILCVLLVPSKMRRPQKWKQPEKWIQT